MEAIKRMGIEKLTNRSTARSPAVSGSRFPLPLARRSAFILMDEPTAHLDYGNQIKVLKTVRSLKEQGYGMILTTHNPDQALLLQGQVAILDRDGRLTTGLSTEVLNEKELTELYGTQLKLFCEEGLDREVCAAPRFVF